MNKITITERKSLSPKPGNIYKMVDPTSHESRFFILVYLREYDDYSLVELSDGVAWNRPTEDINDVFGYTDPNCSNFELVKNAELNIIL